MTGSAAKANILLTGAPGCGKTTVVRRACEKLVGERVVGFYTRELREGTARTGFEAVGLDGDRVTLAHVRQRSAARVGRYGVAVRPFEAFLRRAVAPDPGTTEVCVIDEIGKMECFSGHFVALVRRVLEEPVAVLATVAEKGGGLIAETKRRDETQLLSVTPENRDRLPDDLAARLRR